MFYEGFKDEHERSNVFADNKGATGVEGLGCAAPDERMQMLADIAARTGAESAAQDVIPGSFFGAVSCVCHHTIRIHVQRKFARWNSIEIFKEITL